ncbi:aspartate aminotransferase family protein [Nocardioides lijunqiniae]|uniref:pyridoxal phosphate-dependent decarboxylase family protein n=1 Tax=Nocardioides lijunqiniae TaxID=2760832 RepID=UPI0030B7FB6C
MAVSAVHPLSHLFHPRNVDAYADTMRRGVDHLAATMGGLTGPSTGTSPERAAKAVADVDLDRPLEDPELALAEMSRLYLDDAVWFHDPTYAAHLNCPVVIPALLAEVFVSAVNSSLDTFDQSVGGTFVERHLVDWTNGRIGFGPQADGIFTSGGSQSNLQALLLARDRALAATGADPRTLRVFASTDGHFSVQKAARILGLGDDAVVTIPVDGERRMDAGALGKALADASGAGLVPMAVVATAGTTDFGAIDPLRTVAALCELYGAWCHVDAAYGGGLLASTTRRHLLDGIDQADSVTVDFHKTWFQPVSSSALLVRDGAHLGHVTWHADYLNPKDAEHPNQVDKSLQTTRRFDALKLWLTLRVMGPDQIGEYVDTVVDLAREVAVRIDADPSLEVAATPQLSTVVFRYRPDGLSEDRADLLAPRIRTALYESGAAMVAATKVSGRAWLKLTLLNPMATPEQVLGICARIVAVGDELARDQAAAVVVA